MENKELQKEADDSTGEIGMQYPQCRLAHQCQQEIFEGLSVCRDRFVLE